MESTNSTDARKALVRRLFEDVITLGLFDAVYDIFAEDFSWPQFDLSGPDGVLVWVKGFRAAFPDVQDRVVEQIAEGDTVVTFLSLSGTHKGPYLGVPPTGRHVEWSAVGIDRFRGDRVISRTAYFDVTDLMHRLGVDSIPILATASLPAPVSGHS